jgi:hypothetical protein
MTLSNLPLALVAAMLFACNSEPPTPPTPRLDAEEPARPGETFIGGDCSLDDGPACEWVCRHGNRVLRWKADLQCPLRSTANDPWVRVGSNGRMEWVR